MSTCLIILFFLILNSGEFQILVVFLYFTEVLAELSLTPHSTRCSEQRREVNKDKKLLASQRMNKTWHKRKVNAINFRVGRTKP